MSSAQLAIAASCGTNVIEFRNDTTDSTYFNAQRITTTIEPQDKYRTTNGNNWFGEAPAAVPGSKLNATYTLGWSIEVHYSDATIDSIGEWKYSSKTGNRYAVLRGKHVPTDLTLPMPAQDSTQTNTHLSRKHANQQADWNELDARIDSILSSSTSVEGYGVLTRSSASRLVIGKLAKWIKNYRLKVLMQGGSNIEGAIHPVDFINSTPSYCLGASSTLSTMAAHLGIPARSGRTLTHAWTEVFFDGQWHFVENQPETFLDSVSPAIDVYTYVDGNGVTRRGYQPRTSNSFDTALQREAVFNTNLQDLIAAPQRYGLVEGDNRYAWFFNWSNPFIYDESGSVEGGSWDMMVHPEVYSDGVYTYYYCNYTELHNNGYCSPNRRKQTVTEHMSSMVELGALYPGRQEDLPYVCAKDNGSDPNIMYLTPLRNRAHDNRMSDSTTIVAGGGVRKSFYLSDKDNIDAVYAALYLGPDDNVQYTIPFDGGNWYYQVNGKKVRLSSVNGMRQSDGTNGMQKNYLNTGQTVLRYRLRLEELVSALDCDEVPENDGDSPAACQSATSQVDGLGTPGPALSVEHAGGTLKTAVSCEGSNCSGDRLQFAIYSSAGEFKHWSTSGTIDHSLPKDIDRLVPHGWYTPINFTLNLTSGTTSVFEGCTSESNEQGCRATTGAVDGTGAPGQTITLKHTGGPLKTTIRCTNTACDRDQIQFSIYNDAGQFQHWADSGNINHTLAAGNYVLTPRGWYSPIDFELTLNTPATTVFETCK